MAESASDTHSRPPILSANNILALPFHKEMCIESLSTGGDSLLFLMFLNKELINGQHLNEVENGCKQNKCYNKKQLNGIIITNYGATVECRICKQGEVDQIRYTPKKFRPFFFNFSSEKKYGARLFFKKVVRK